MAGADRGAAGRESKGIFVSTMVERRWEASAGGGVSDVVKCDGGCGEAGRD